MSHNTLLIKLIILPFLILISTGQAIAQPVQVSGRVFDYYDQDMGIPGATIMIKGTTSGTVSDVQGQYSITVPSEDAVLVVSFVGYVTEELMVGNQREIDFYLVPDITQLEEMVVVGYGVQRKSDLTGAVSRVTAEDFQNAPIVNIGQALQGRAAGVNITQDNGAPGGGLSIKIRGIGSIGDNEPLYVIDGFPTKGGLNNLNPNDIESIDILKDASATAIYGARGANGVIIITTKRGTSDTPVFSFDAYSGIQIPTNMPDMLNSVQYAELYNEIRFNDAKQRNRAYEPYFFWNPQGDGVYREEVDTVPLAQWIPDAYPNTNWLNEVIRPAIMHNYNLSVQGGSENSRYMISGGYVTQEGIIRGSNYDRLNLRINTDNTLKSWLKIGNSFNISNTTRNSVVEEGVGRTVIARALRIHPTLAPYREDGSFSSANDNPGSIRNPLRDALMDTDESRSFSFIGNIYADVNFLEDFTYRLNLGGSFSNSFRTIFEPAYGQTGDKWFNELADAQRNNSRFTNVLMEHTLNYQKSIDRHNISLLIGYTAQEDRGDFMSARVQGFTHPALTQLSSGQEFRNISGSIEEWALLSQLARFNYNYDTRYYLTASIRRDGSSRFGSNHRWGIFPSFAARWRVSRENFMQNVDFINDLSLRGGFGRTGNQEIGNYTHFPQLTPVSYTSGNTLLLNAGLAPNHMVNDDLRWESTKMTNLGFDLSLMDYSLQITMDYYHRGTDDMLLQKPIPITSGYPTVPRLNIGEVINQGVDASIIYKWISGNFNLTTDFNVGYNYNEVRDLGGGTPIQGGSLADAGMGFVTLTNEGYPIGSFYGYVYEGIFQSWEEVRTSPLQHANTAPGDVRFADLNGDGRITGEDRTYIGSPWPDWTFGLNTTVGYRNFGLNIFLQGVQGNKIYNFEKSAMERMSGTNNHFATVENRWTEENPSQTMHRAIQGDPNQNNRISSYWLEDGSYLRIKNVVLSYNLPASTLAALNITRVQIYVSGSNLYTFTRFTGFDPELGLGTAAIGGSTIGSGLARGQYPLSRSFNLGINLSF